MSDRRQVELVLSQMSAIARSANALLAAAYLAPAEDEGEAVVVAGLVATAIDRRALDTDIPLLGEVLLAGFDAVDQQGDQSRQHYVEIEPPSLTKVRDLDCVKLVRLGTHRNSREQELKQFEQSYLVPVGSGDGVVVLTFSTINFEYAKQFSELFEKIAGTLRILYPEDPTFEDEPQPRTPDPSRTAPT